MMLMTGQTQQQQQHNDVEERETDDGDRRLHVADASVTRDMRPLK